MSRLIVTCVVADLTQPNESIAVKLYVFESNGDLINEYFTIYGGKTVVNIKNLKIFARAGHLMYQKELIFPAAESEGWNGRFNGSDAPIGVYVYFAEVTYIDGKKELIKGDFTLMR